MVIWVIWVYFLELNLIESTIFPSYIKRIINQISIIRFHRGQPVYVEGKDLSRFAANISAIGTEAVNNLKHYIYHVLLLI